MSNLYEQKWSKNRRFIENIDIILIEENHGTPTDTRLNIPSQRTIYGPFTNRAIINSQNQQPQGNMTPPPPFM